jgi:predicted aldo/keto reductase-like oxidoreductase
MTRAGARTPEDPAGSAAGLAPPLSPWLSCPATAFGRPVGGSSIAPDDVLYALERGVNFLNWPGEADTPGGSDAFSDAVAALGVRRESVVVCVQFGARTATDAAGELRWILAALRTDFIDMLTFYYVERAAEWRALIGPGGAMEYCRAARRDGVIRLLGITSHQRPLAAAIAGAPSARSSP